MYLKIFFNAILIILLIVVQFGLVTALPSFYSGINVLLVAIIFVLALWGEKVAWWWVLSIASIYDMISYTPMGVFLVTYVLVFFVVNFLQKNFFTNRSLYSFLVLTTFATISYKSVLYLSSTLFFMWSKEVSFNLFYNKFWLSELYSLLLNICLVFLVYNVINFVSKRLKPTFLVRR